MATTTKIVQATWVPVITGALDAVAVGVAQADSVETVLAAEYANQWSVRAFAIGPDFTFFFLMEHD